MLRLPAPHPSVASARGSQPSSTRSPPCAPAAPLGAGKGSGLGGKDTGKCGAGGQWWQRGSALQHSDSFRRTRSLMRSLLESLRERLVSFSWAFSLA